MKVKGAPDSLGPSLFFSNPSMVLSICTKQQEAALSLFLIAHRREVSVMGLSEHALPNTEKNTFDTFGSPALRLASNPVCTRKKSPLFATGLSHT